MVAPSFRPPARGFDAAPLAFFALVGGATAMGISPIFVRFAEIGPFASAFWRVALALPALWLWSQIERPPVDAAPPDRGARQSVVLAGLFFAADLSFWHLAIMHTTVANATFLATLAPVWVVLGSSLFLGESVERQVFPGLALCLIGAAALIGGTWSLNPERLDGDLYGLATSFFFGAYFLAVRRARRVYGSGRTLFLSSIVTAAVLLVQAVIIESQMWPTAALAVAALFALALVSHSGGQGLLAFALGHLPAAFSALVIFLEAIAAAAFGWMILGERLGWIQAIGAVAIFAGIFVARPRRT
ncbi:MAG TPA: DMT family transporter [Propylenella sp.]|nr:DMT family transporter [Propylenella sp.]